MGQKWPRGEFGWAQLKQCPRLARLYMTTQPDSLLSRPMGAAIAHGEHIVEHASTLG
jgi:hypothetical protein